MLLALAKYRWDAYAGLNDHTRYDQVSNGRKPQFSPSLSLSLSLSLSHNYLNLLIFVILVMKKEFH